MMILALHNLAESYKILPSEALVRASTFDLYVLDTHLKHMNHLQKQNENGSVDHKLTQEEMKAMIDRVRNKNGANS